MTRSSQLEEGGLIEIVDFDGSGYAVQEVDLPKIVVLEGI